MTSHVIIANNITLAYKKTEPVIRDSSFVIESGKFVFITGPSGSGKSTLLQSFYGAIRPQGGDLEVAGVKMGTISGSRLNVLRRHMGIIFQDYKLIKEWVVEKNVMLPLIIAGYSKDVCHAQAQKLLAHVKLTSKSKKFPQELSGGEQQRVAMARALAHNPVMILADEPTGSLDDYSSDVIWGLLEGANKQLGTTIVVATHHIPASLKIPYKHMHIEDGVVYEIA